MKTTSQQSSYSHRRPAKTARKILIIEDDRALSDLLRDYLETKKGFDVLTAGAGEDGMKAAVEDKPDLILLDFRLGEMSGLLLHDKLFQNPDTREIPVIYVSSFIPLRTIEQATIRGAKGFISKPFTLSEMYTKVATVLGST